MMTDQRWEAAKKARSERQVELVAQAANASPRKSVVEKMIEAKDRISHFAEKYRLTNVQMAETAGLKASTLTRKDRRDSVKAQTRIREMEEILARVEEWAGSPFNALSWYRAEPIPALDGRTAEALVKSGEANAVREYLDHVALGGFA